MLAAAMAAAVRATGTYRLALVHVRAGVAEPDWSAALEWAQTRLLPLIFVVADSRGPGAFRASAGSSEDVLSWAPVEHVARKLKLPVLSVDGEDAVAVYRVMQESVIRARAGGGPAILWAMLPGAKDLAAGRSSTLEPVARLQRYLRRRKIALQ